MQWNPTNNWLLTAIKCQVATLIKVKADIVSIKGAIDSFRLRERRLPDSLEALTEEDEDGYMYLDTLPNDPFDNPYEYEPDGNKYIIRCNGEPNCLPSTDFGTGKRIGSRRELFCSLRGTYCSNFFCWASEKSGWP